MCSIISTHITNRENKHNSKHDKSSNKQNFSLVVICYHKKNKSKLYLPLFFQSGLCSSRSCLMIYGIVLTQHSIARATKIWAFKKFMHIIL